MQDLGIRVLFDGENGIRLLMGLLVTIKLSIITIIASYALGIIMGMLMTLKNPVIHFITRIYLEFIRIMPQLVLLFIAYFGLTRATGINLSGFIAAVIVFILWGKHAQEYEPYIKNKHVIKSPHPSPFSARKGFFGSKPFTKTNQYLVENGSPPIDWGK